jgi:hypothetical protein
MFRVPSLAKATQLFSKPRSFTKSPSIASFPALKQKQPFSTSAQPPTENPSVIAKKVKERNNSLDLMNDIQQAVDRRHGGNNASMPRQKPDVTLVRRDNYPFNSIQPSYGTPKTAINQKGELQPVGNDHNVSLAAHVDGAKEVKARSPYTSFSGPLTGVDGTAPKVLIDSPAYGKNRILTNPSQNQKMGDVFDQYDIQRNIRTSPDRNLDETAVLRTDPKKPLWQPTLEERALMPRLGIDPNQSSFTFRERAMVNSARDNEYLIKGPLPEDSFKLQEPTKDGTFRTLSAEEVLAHAQEKNHKG